MNYYKFDCGCELPIIDDNLKNCDGLPSLDIDFYNLPDCQETWDIFRTGRTKGVFQLEKQLGQTWSALIQPDSINDVSALVALIRPGCISGDTLVLRRYYKDSNSRKHSYIRSSIRDYYNNFNKNNKSAYKTAVSYNEETGTLVQNKVKSVTYSGNKDVYKIKFRKFAWKAVNNKVKSYTLECTLDHKLLTQRGWIELQNMQVGDRFAVLKFRGSKQSKKLFPGQRSFKEICFRHYLYKCLFCNWNSGSLDVNHIEGNRFSNNKSDNLCFLCPNHHRMYSEGSISKEEILLKREEYKIPQSRDVEWIEYLGKEFSRNIDTYDISMNGPHHNFIAGNVVVHNCLQSIVDGKNMTQHYSDRKSGKEEINYFYDALEPILKETYGVITYQEQSIRIVKDLAGFSLQEADNLRKAIGKKDPKLMLEMEKLFLEKAKTANIVNEEAAKQIFSWIKESNRYSFNKSHSAGYAQLGYWSAFVKHHFPLHFYTSWIHNRSNDKNEDENEADLLINDAKLFDISIGLPSLLNVHDGDPGSTVLINNRVFLGIDDIKSCGRSNIDKLIENVRILEQKFGPINTWEWMTYLVHLLSGTSSTIVNGLISSGALNHIGKSRTHLLFEYNLFKKLTDAQVKILKEYNFPNLKEALVFLTSHKKVRNVDKILDMIKVYDIPPYSLKDGIKVIADMEQQYLGIPISCTRLDARENIYGDTTCLEFSKGKNEKIMNIAVEITSVRENTIKNGKSAGRGMGFINVTDGTASLNVVAFAEMWEKNRDLFYKGNTLVLTGKKSSKGSFQIEKVKQI